MVEHGDPSCDPPVLEDLEVLEKQYNGEKKDALVAFVETIRNKDSLPGISRSVVFARGQRFLISLAMEIEDEAGTKVTKKKAPREKKQTERPEATFDPELLTLDGVGPKTAARLSSRGLNCPRDLLFVLPRRYDDRRTVTPIADLKHGMRIVTSGIVERVRVYGRPWKRIMDLEITDGDATLRGMWFTNRRPRPDSFEKGKRVILAGLVSNYKGRLQIAHPVVVKDEAESDRIGRVVPVYPEVPGVAGRTVEKAVRSAARNATTLIDDPLPEGIQTKRDLMPLAEALQSVHLPPLDIGMDALDAWVDGSSPAHRRLAYDEFFFVQLALAKRRRSVITRDAPTVSVKGDIATELGSHLGFEPTHAQRRVISEILADLEREGPMQRLLQGDVGCGKTFVAIAAMLAAARSGHQAALMAPTEILAEQHMRTIYPILSHFGITAALHIGAARSSTRKKNLAGFESGRTRVAIGTHALIQESIAFRSLGLAVVDEQHRFGVSQRLGLVGKGPLGTSPHLLVMTATPIPRTLALTVHGDLDISSVDELPPGRSPVETTHWSNTERSRVIALAKEAVARGEQVYVVCPVIEESEKLDVRAAEDVFEEYREVFGPEETRLLHGRLPQEEKESAMQDFTDGVAKVLVATTVVEVGVDVANATVMIIEGAERFGLAQLHQLRGRVGRSDKKSYCHLISDATGDDAVARIGVLTRTCDGFELAEADLEIRGPGELYGRRQAGLPGFRYGNLMRDADFLRFARQDVGAFLEADPELRSASGQALKKELLRRVLADEGPIGEEAG